MVKRRGTGTTGPDTKARPATPTDPATAVDRGTDGSGALGFEAALQELETLVEQLEDGELELEQALASFERGVALSRRCGELLDRAERRIEMLVDEGGKIAIRPLDSEDLAPTES